MSHARPTTRKKAKTYGGRDRQTKRLLTSDTLPAKSNGKQTVNASKADTARNRVRRDIAENTKPKRDTFLLAHRHYFLPLLPETSYIDKLERAHAMTGEDDPEPVPYVKLNQQPVNVKAIMKPYQLDGLSFLVHMYHNGTSAILGDEMGLGKTLQTLSLFEYLKEHQPVTGETRPFLVVCPLSVLSSWINEAKKWTPRLNVIRFHGPKSERDRLKQETTGQTDRYGNTTKGTDSRGIDLVVTTYETFNSEQGWFKRAFVWRYVVLDEGHKIKNDKSDISSALQGLSAEHRLLLTGTPLQNNLHEMWALLHWLYPEVFTADTADNFKQSFDLTKGRVSTRFMDDARRLLEVVMLRRMKSSPGVDLDLPPKEEVLLFVPLTPMQRFWYQRLLTRLDKASLEELFDGSRDKEASALKQEADDAELKMLEKAGQAADKAANADTRGVWAESKEIMEHAIQQEQAESKPGEWKKLMNLIAQLRKVCSHPYLLPNAYPEPYYLGDHVRVASGKFIVLDKIVEELVVKQKKKILIFAGWTSTLDMCEDLLTLKGANVKDASFRYLRFDGGTDRAKRNLGIRMFNDLKSDYRVMLISTKAGGLGINLASASDVIFMDEDWNPQITLQAEARAHRIGQTQKVTVYKLCSQGTVEEQMMGRIRKKLYLSAKITESMRNIHGEGQDTSKKRKRGPSNQPSEEDAPPLGTGQLKSLLRRGAQTLSGPELDVTEMIGWDWETTLEKCKDRPQDALVADATGAAAEVDEQQWLNQTEKVECAVFEGKKHQRAIEQAVKNTAELTRAERRIGKNTTVMIDGFAINKDSMNCADWEAVPTMAGKDPRLAEPVKIKKEPIINQEHCQVCWDGGNIVLCSGCPRSYHVKCLNKEFQLKAKAKMNFFCPQHKCADCDKSTSDCGGLVYRCRWCENGYCEDCLDWETTKLLGDTLPEFEMLRFGAIKQAWFVECHNCVACWADDKQDKQRMLEEKRFIERKYMKFVSAEDEMAGLTLDGAINLDSAIDTPETVSEAMTPIEVVEPIAKKQKKGFFAGFLSA